MRALVRRMRREDAGISMAELLVSSMLTVVVMALVGTMFVQVTRITTASNETQDYNGLASNAANELSAVLRVATTLAKSNVATPDPAIVAGTRSSLTIYTLSNTSATNPAPAKVTFTLDATEKITETRCTGVASGGFWTFTSCASTSSRSFGMGILLPTSTSNQLFTYRDVNGDPILIGTGSLTAAQRAQVASITVTIRVKTVDSSTGAVLVSNTVVLRNLGLDSGS
jgi:Tfp pilus assembly protein PilW